MSRTESAINGSLFIYLSEDDMSDVLTPNHLMYDHNIRRKGNIVISEDIMKDQSKRFS